MSDFSDRIAKLSPKRLAFLAMELQSQLDAATSGRNEPIAIVGIGCRVPGAGDPDGFWRVLDGGVDAITDIPADRWDVDAFYDPDPDAAGKMYVRRGGFLKDIDRFDPHFFGISPREAATLDPQHRLLLEVCWEALESAGQRPDGLEGSPTGVFVGISSSDFANLPGLSGASTDVYSGTGASVSVAAGRLSYSLGLQGPCLAVDTACSSSLVAVHLAAQSLRQGECALALAGGVNIILSPGPNVYLSRARMLAPDGRCKTFDAAADGYVRSEGCGIVVLKRLSDARAAGDRILAVIRGSAINQDGRSSGLTAPNGPSQESVVREALARAGVQPSEIDYVEAHGTGTSLGDPIEVQALGAIHRGRPADNPLLLGSVKTNVGHLEAAAGIAALIKVVLALEHERIPPHINFRNPSPHIPWSSLPIRITAEGVPWQRGASKRLAGVSSFGFSGTNAHVIVEEAPPAQAAEASVDRPRHLIAVSARSDQALRELARRHAGCASGNPETIADVCFTANAGRSHFDHRLAVTGSSASEISEGLNAFAAGGQAPNVRTGRSTSESGVDVAFLFTGQGAQYAGMGRELYDTQPAFRRTLDKCAAILASELDRPLLDVLYPKDGAPSPIDETAYTQPAMFAVEYALAELWRSWGVRPAAVVGHSIGEFVAACVAGVFSLEDALKLVAARGRLMQALPKNGAMAALGVSESRVRAVIAPYASSVSVAAINAADQIVIAGDRVELGKALAALEADGVRAIELPVSHAFHSPLVEPMLDEFTAAASRVTFREPQLDIVASLTGRMAGPGDLVTPGYWRRQAREAVQFAQAAQTLRQTGARVFIEVGPRPTLIGLAQRGDVEPGSIWLPTLRPGQSEWTQLLESLATAYVAGVAVDWAAFDREYTRHKTSVPTYPFQRQRYWPERGRTAAGGTESHSEGHPLLGARVSTALRDQIFESQLIASSDPFLADHRLHQAVVFPGTGYVGLAMLATRDLRTTQSFELEDFVISQPLVLSDDARRTVQTIVTPDEHGGASFQVLSRDRNVEDSRESWILHATGKVASGQPTPATNADSLDAVRSRSADEIDTESYYDDLRASGLDFGPSFRGITGLWRGDGECVGRIQSRLQSADDAYLIHPAMLDACFQVLGAALSSADNADGSSFVPLGIARLTVLRAAGTTVWSHVRVLPQETVNRDTLTADVTVYDDAGNLLAFVEGLQLARARRESIARKGDHEVADWLYEPSWQQAALQGSSRQAVSTGAWLVFEDSSGAGRELSRRLAARGDAAFIVKPGTSYVQREPGVVEIDPEDPSHVERLFTLAGEHGGVRGVLHLWSLDPPSTVDTAGLVTSQRLTCATVLHTAQRLIKTGGSDAALWVVTRGAQPVGKSQRAVAVEQSPVWGLCRSIVAEHPEQRCVRIDLDPSSSADVDAVWRELAENDGEDQVAFRAGARHVLRLVRSARTTVSAEASNDAPLRLETAERGVLENLTLRPVLRRAPGPGEVEVRTVASGLNFRDVLNALGMYPGDPGPLGNELVGIVERVGPGVSGLQVGQQVFGMGSGTFASHVTTLADWVIHTPKLLSAIEAATIPITFLTAEYSLNRVARMASGDRVLIHAAAGGVGLAAVQLALGAGCEVFATAGSDEKRALLHSMGVRHVFDSRSLAFADQIMSATSGEGVDIALNSLAGEFIPKTLGTLRAGGRFLELGKTGIWDPERLRSERPDIAYHVIFLGELEPSLINEMLRSIAQQLEAGRLKPLPVKTFDLSEAVAAFRYMAQARHIGKIVLVAPAPGRARSSAAPIRSDRAYLITGGCGDLGLLVARWLLTRGARHVALMGRRAPGEDAGRAIADLNAQGADVQAFAGDVSVEADVSRVLSQVRDTMAPVAGIVHAAGVLQDAALLQQQWPMFEPVLLPKVSGAWNLHTATRDLALDFFVMFSSAASMIGSGGQANYAAANAFLDALAHQRQLEGLPAVSINWGPWSGGGMAASMDRRSQRRWADAGINPIDPDGGLLALERVLGDGGPQVTVMPIHWRTFLRPFAPGAEPRLLAAFARSREVTAAPSPADGRPELVALVEHTMGSERARVVGEYLRDQLRRMLDLDAAYPIEPHQGLRDIGLDSLLSVELRNRLRQATGKSLPATLAFDCPTLQALTDRIVSILPAAAQAVEPGPARSKERAPVSPPEVAVSEPIAIVGMSCRFPGGASSPDAFWTRLREGFDAISEVPADRWDVDRFYDPDPDAPGKMYSRHGGFLDRVDLFDPQFFNVSPREAISLDPQQRLLLEVSWEALERAAQAPDRLMGSKTGVFIGISSTEYGYLQMAAAESPDLYFGTGNALSTAAGRLSYVLGLQGPSLAVDTACSSSLMALHLACHSLRSRECHMALAGGVNVMLTPDITMNFCRAHMLAPDGHCKTFDAAADGYVRGEGCGMVVLKRLSDAVANGDRILAIIRSSAANQDGRSSGLTVPNGPAQESLIKEALAAAGLSARDVSYVEAHGTGTALGDPIELQALGAALGNRPDGDRLLVGSVKTNIGHLESAAGIAGLMKVVLALQHEEIPPSLHFSTPNPYIPWAELPIDVVTERRVWPSDRGRRVAGVSSFGFSGTNVHVLLEAAPPIETTPVEVERLQHVLALSARSPEALTELAGEFAAALGSADAPALADVCFSANAGRSHFVHRLALTAGSSAEAAAMLKAFASGRESRPNLWQGQSPASQLPVAFLFDAPVAQSNWDELYETQGAFRETFERCVSVVGTGHADVAGPYALAALWRSWGVEPAMVIGRGAGENLAACLAGVFNLEEGLRLAAGEKIDASRLTRQRPRIPIGADPGRHLVVEIASGEWSKILGTLAHFYVNGAAIDWAAVDRDYPRRKVALPTYPFQRQRYWIETTHTRSASAATRGSQTSKVSADRLYEVTWHATPVANTSSDPQPGSWLMLGSPSPLLTELAPELERRGGLVVRIDRGQDQARAIEAFLTSLPAPHRVVSLQSVDPGDAVSDQGDLGLRHCEDLLETLKVLARAELAQAPRLWVVTSGAQYVSGSPASPRADQTALWGLGRAIAAEHAGIWGGLIDLDRDDDPASTAIALADALMAGDGEDQTAIRRDRRFVARLGRKALAAAAEDTRWRPDAAYIVTGGFGGLGFQVARWLARAGARRLILLARQAPPPRASWPEVAPDSPMAARIAAVLELEALGATVDAESVDVGDRSQVVAWLDRYRRERRPAIRGVFHAAGVTQYRALADQTNEELRSVWSGKASGAWTLHELLADLDCFVLFSSASAVLNSPMLGSYAAANAFLDGLAEVRRSAGQPVLSVNWGMWSQVGMGTLADAGSQDAQQVISPEEGIDTLAALLARNVSRAAVLPMDWSAWSRRYPDFARAALLRDVVGGASNEPAARARESIRPALLAADAAGRLVLIRDVIAQSVSAALRTPVSSLDRAVPMRNMGLDSLMALELRNRIHDQVGITVPLVAIVEGPSVDDLSALVLGQFEETSGATQDTEEPFKDAGSDARTLLAQVDDLSDEHVDALLKRMLTERGT